jgi:hypothetical protein
MSNFSPMPNGKRLSPVPDIPAHVPIGDMLLSDVDVESVFLAIAAELSQPRRAHAPAYIRHRDTFRPFGA